MLVAISMGLLLAAVTISIHAVCTAGLIRYLMKSPGLFRSKYGDLKVCSLTAVWLLSIHILETLVWAFAYLWLETTDEISTIEDAAYFATVTFTTLGYGDIVIEGPWRMLAASHAMTGLLVFGWSTALLFSVVERIWKQRFSFKQENSKD